MSLRGSLANVPRAFGCVDGVSSLSPPDQALSRQRTSVSAVTGTDHTRPPGRHGGSGRHGRLGHAPHKPRRKPRSEPHRPLSDTEPVCSTAPASPGAPKDLPSTGLIRPLLTSLTQEVTRHRLGQGEQLHTQDSRHRPVIPSSCGGPPAAMQQTLSSDILSFELTFSCFLCHTGTSD